MAIPKLKIDLSNYYLLLGWIFVLAGIMGVLFIAINPTSLEAALGFSVASFACGIIMIYLGTKRKTVFRKKK